MNKQSFHFLWEVIRLHCNHILIKLKVLNLVQVWFLVLVLLFVVDQTFLMNNQQVAAKSTSREENGR